MKRVGVVVHPTREVMEAVEVLRRWTEERDLELVQILAGKQQPVATLGEVHSCDLIAALGGDGTVLKALHAAHETETPVLGVAYGSLGALSAVPQSQLRSGLERFAASDWSAERLPALRLASAEGRLASAINDIVILRGGGTQLILDVHVEGELYTRLAGDGVVVATPLGSSAYSMAAGGPVLAADASAFICTPLAMHGGCAPPLVVAGQQNVTLQIHPTVGGFEVAVDGFKLPTESDRFEIACEGTYATLVKLDGSRSGVTRLRERGLIADSPRIVAEVSRDLDQPG
jgi:NAD+ kinase